MTLKFYLTVSLVLIVMATGAQTQKIEYKSRFGKLDFTSTRTTINDTVFIDSGLLCASDTAKVCSITFKKVGLAWFVQVDGQWQEFYNPLENQIQVVYFKKEKYILKPIGHSMTYGGVSLLGFMKEDLYVHSSHQSTLWFDPDFGVVIIEGDVELIREDFEKSTKE